MKQKLILATAAAAFLAVSGVAHANLIKNAGFESGYANFTSDYTYSPTDMYPPATFTVDSSPANVHSSWVYGPAPHEGSKMLIVNGSTEGNKTLWRGELTSPLISGVTYTFSAWVANIYPQSPAQMQLTISGNPLPGNINLPSDSNWHFFSRTFTFGPGSGDAGLLDLNTLYSGNDFAIDELSLTAVPEPSTVIAGALLLLPFGLSTVRSLRKNRA